ncbi:MAG: hypothetical protein VX345_07060, partial [Pseudomonadota bacterium]|nr:hypothetical protein [Pseudomonadota bacterium]
TCYLMIGEMVRLAPKLRAELPAGALVVSNAFTLPDWPPEQVVTVAAYQNTPVYLYRQPLAAQEASATPVGGLWCRRGDTEAAIVPSLGRSEDG